MTHLCSVRVTHTKNTICRSARKAAGDIIHAEGVRAAVPSSAPQPRKLLSLRKEICLPMRTINHWGVARPGSRVICPRAKKDLPGGKGPVAWLWCWVTFGEQSMVISRECRSAHGFRTVRKWREERRIGQPVD